MYGENVTMRVSVDETAVKLRVLVVDDDSTCLAIVASMLKLFGYEVATTQDPLQALSTLEKKHQSFNLLLTDIHMPFMNGIELQKQVRQKFGIPVILMSGDDNRSTAIQGLEQGASYFILKPPTLNDIKNLWQHVISNKNNKNSVDISPERHIISCNEVSVKSSKSNDMPHISSPITEEKISLDYENPKMLEEPEEVEEKSENNNNVIKYTKRAKKLVWTTSLHNKFLEAVGTIGLDRSVPKKILEYMNMPGLTRENIASHLQKYRIYLRRVMEAKDSMKHGIPENWNAKPFKSAFSWSEFPSLAHNSFLLNSHLVQQPPTMHSTQTNNYDHGNHHLNNNMAHLNPAFTIPSQGLNNFLLNTTQTNNNNNTSFVQPIMNHIISPNVANYESAYHGGQVNILESSMLDNNGQNNFVNDITNGSSINTQVHHDLVANQGRGLFSLDNKNRSIWDEQSLWDIPLPQRNNRGASVFDNNVTLQGNNNFNGGIQLQGNRAIHSNEPIARNHIVVDQQQAAFMSNMNNNNVPATYQQLPVVENNGRHNMFQVTGPSEHNQEMPNYDLLGGSPSGFQDWAMQNLDEFSMDGIDDLADFLLKK